LLGLPALVGLLSLVRSPKAYVVGTAAVVPIVALGLVSILRPVYLPGRYELQAFAPFIALWAVGMEALVCRIDRPGVGWAVAAAGAVAAFVVSGPYVFAKPSPKPYSALSEWLVERPDDEHIIAVGLTRAPLEHQLRAGGGKQTIQSYPPDIADHIGWWHPKEYELDALIAAGLTLARAETAAVWIVLPLVDGQPAWSRGTGVLMEAFRRSGWNREPPQGFGEFGVVRLTRANPG
ncbi:MAG: hypothetical protein ACI9OJ_004073, partial [Myxococcota bacterium]